MVALSKRNRKHKHKKSRHSKRSKSRKHNNKFGPIKNKFKSRSRSKYPNIGYPTNVKIPEHLYDKSHRDYISSHSIKTPYSDSIISGPYNTRVPLGLKKKYSTEFIVAGPHNKIY